MFDFFMIESTKFEWHDMIRSKKLKKKNLSKTTKETRKKCWMGAPTFIIVQDTQEPGR